MAFAGVLGESAANLLEPWPLKIVLDNVIKDKGGTHGFLVRFIHHLAGYDPVSILKLACIGVLAIAALDAVCSYAEKYLTTSVGQWITHDLRRGLYAHIQRLSLAYHDTKRSGDLISRITDDVDAVQTFITTSLLGAVVNAVTLLGMIVVMCYLNWKFTLIALSVAPVLFGLIYIYTRRIKQASRAVRKKQGEIVSVVEEVFSAMRVVKAFSQEEYETKRLEEESLEGVEIALRARALKAKLAPLVAMVVAVGTALVFWFGARMVLAGALSGGALIVFVLYLARMYKPMRQLSQVADAYSKACVGWERIQEIFSTDRRIRDLPRSRPAPRLRGAIEFDHVSFYYQPDNPILTDICLKVEPGQLAALVGPTGAGKTTIASLIARFYDPVSGVVKIDGSDVRNYRQASLRSQISFVLQETLLFHGTLWHNIAYGKPEATRREIMAAAEAANATEFIDKLPEGYDTMVGERGVTLSGGQRQRIAIARAVIRKSPILILDEPSSGLDAESERLVFEALDRLMQGKTAVVIAHRLSTIRSAHTIFVVQGGEIVERGNHDELSRRDGLYAHLSELQTSPAA